MSLYLKINYCNKDDYFFDVLKVLEDKNGTYIFKDDNYTKTELLDPKNLHKFHIYDWPCKDSLCLGCYNECLAKKVELLTEEMLSDLTRPGMPTRVEEIIKEFIREKNEYLIDRQKKEKIQRQFKNDMKVDLKKDWKSYV